MQYIDLVLMGGDLVRIECPNEHHDECMDTLSDAMKRGDWWSPNRFDGCSAEYLGLLLDRVAMGRVMGML